MSLKEKFEASGLTQADIARVIGKGVGVVNGVINGSYKSANKELYENAIENYLNNYIADNGLTHDEILPQNELKSKTDKKIPNEPWLSLAQTKIKERVLNMLSSNLSFFELIFGSSGMGKTYLLKSICKDRNDALYIKARKSLSASSFMSLILKNLNEKPKGNTDDKLDMVIESLEKKGIRLLVIDESDLFSGDSENTFKRKFELLREIFEYFRDKKVGVVLICVGLTELKNDINNLGGYIKSRFTYSPEMSLSTQELIKIGELNGLSKSMSEYLAEDNNARTFEKTRANMELGYSETVAANLVYIKREQR
ncbi:MAG: ATP-binding protein [Campylobacter sp.]|nr:ATP-binding protein [Campylobacter sp.]